jgi:ankyrin repeat protein
MRLVTSCFVLCLAASAAACRPDSQSPLVQAAVLGRADDVARLLANGAKPSERTSRGFSVLGLAARAGQVAVIEQFVEAGADPNIRDTNENEWTPLLNAVHKHQRAAAAALLRLGADPDMGGGRTPLIMAAGYGDTDMVRLLLDGGADPYHGVKPGENALGAAVGGSADIDDWKLGHCQIDTVKLLLDRAPDLRLRPTILGRLDLWVARMGNCTEVLSLIEGPRKSPPTAAARTR